MFSAIGSRIAATSKSVKRLVRGESLARSQAQRHTIGAQRRLTKHRPESRGEGGAAGYRSSWWSASLLRLCLERGGLTRSGRWRLSGFWARKAAKRGRVRNAVVADIIEDRHLQRSLLSEIRKRLNSGELDRPFALRPWLSRCGGERLIAENY